MKKLLSLLGILVCIFLNAQLIQSDHFALVKLADKIRTTFTKSYWAEWAATRFNILLVDDEYEYVLNTKAPDTSFEFSADHIPFRKATFARHFLATFPLIDGKPTIVVGTPPNTGKSPEAWVVTLLHEHFHQLQFSHAQYYSDLGALDLDRGDETGMWVLNHPFPYDQAEVIQHIREMSKNLLRIYDAHPDFDELLNKHKLVKRQLKEVVGTDHYAYLNLQLWQEGFARFVEIRLLKDWIENFEHVDQQAFSKAQLTNLLNEYHGRIKNDLIQGDLAGKKRGYFYSLGAAEAMLIAQTNPSWREQYFDTLFDTDHLLVTR